MILITGGSGFLGINIVRQFLKRDESVRVFDLVDIDKDVKKDVDFVKGSITNYNLVRELCKDVDIVYHTVASLPIAKAGMNYIKVNVKGTYNILQSAYESGVKRFIHISTSAMYGAPTEKQCPINEESPFYPLGHYGKSKSIGEGWCRKYREFGLNVSIVRPRAIIGKERLGIFQILFDWIRRGKKIYIIGNGENLCQFLHIDDLVDACIKLKKHGAFEDFNIGTDKFNTIGKDLNSLIKHAKTKAKLVPVNPFIAKNSLFILDKLKLSPFVDWHYLTFDNPFYFDVSKAKKMLKWGPKYSNAKMLCDAYDWYIEHRKKADTTMGVTHRKGLNQGILKLLRWIS